MDTQYVPRVTGDETRESVREILLELAATAAGVTCTVFRYRNVRFIGGNIPSLVAMKPPFTRIAFIFGTTGDPRAPRARPVHTYVHTYSEFYMRRFQTALRFMKLVK